MTRKKQKTQKGNNNPIQLKLDHIMRVLHLDELQWNKGCCSSMKLAALSPKPCDTKLLHLRWETIAFQRCGCSYNKIWKKSGLLQSFYQCTLNDTFFGLHILLEVGLFLLVVLRQLDYNPYNSSHKSSEAPTFLVDPCT